LAAPRAATDPVGFVLPIVEWDSRNPLAGRGLTATLCPVAQFTCENPLAPPFVVQEGVLGTLPLPLSTAGVPVPEGFDGFVKFDVLAPPDVTNDQQFVPVSYYLGGPISGDISQGPPILMTQRGLLDAMRQQAFADIDADTLQRFGLLQLGVYGCNGTPVNDARIELVAGGQAPSSLVPYQLPASRIPIAVPPDQPLYTGTSGLVGYWGVPAGAVQARAYRRGDTAPFATAELGSVPGQMSQASIRPPYLNDANVVGTPIGN
jgi:hypothetical protein